MKLSDAVRGSVFFPRFLPSFSRLGFCSRNLLWGSELRDFSDQEWLVTGASSGIGRTIALRAAEAGAMVHVVARSEDRLQALAEEVPDRIVVHAVDLSSMTAVAAFVAEVAAATPKIDVLVNNVGLMLDRREPSADGIEKSFATNVLGHFLLTEALRDAGALDGSVVVNMSSGGMYNVALDLDELQGGRSYNGTITYAYQKRAQVVLNRWWREQGLNSYVMHPGWVNTPGVETAMPEFHLMTRPLLRNADEGADTALWLAARRPAQNTADGIWFDRGLRSAHFLPGTSAGANPEALVAYLQEQLPVLDGSEAESPATDAQSAGSVLVEKPIAPRAHRARMAG
ncbi:MAG: SDR family NAD(P)-dependent oxidoreductase [Pseudomonadota bacterium]